MILIIDLNTIRGSTLVILGHGFPYTGKHDDFQFYLLLGLKRQIFNTLDATGR